MGLRQPTAGRIQPLWPCTSTRYLVASNRAPSHGRWRPRQHPTRSARPAWIRLSCPSGCSTLRLPATRLPVVDEGIQGADKPNISHATHARPHPPWMRRGITRPCPDPHSVPQLAEHSCSLADSCSSWPLGPSFSCRRRVGPSSRRPASSLPGIFRRREAIDPALHSHAEPSSEGGNQLGRQAEPWRPVAGPHL